MNEYIRNQPNRHQRCEARPRLQGRPIPSSLKVKRCCHLRKDAFAKKINLTVFMFTDLTFDPVNNQLHYATTDILDRCETSGSGGLRCSHVRAAGPCRVSITGVCEVAPRLPQGGVDLRDGARILHFTWETSLRDVLFTWLSLKDLNQLVSKLCCVFILQSRQKPHI